MSGVTLNPGDLQAGCALFALEREPELYLRACQAVYRDLKPGETFVLEVITVHGDGRATAEFRAASYGSTQLGPDSRTCTFRAFPDGKAARAYLREKENTWNRNRQLLRDLAATCPVPPRAARQRR